MKNYLNFKVDHCAPYGSYWNPVIINSITQTNGVDYLSTNKPVLPCFDSCTKAHSFWMYIPQCLKFDDTSIIGYTEDTGTTNYFVYDRIGNYMRADRLKHYEGGKQLLHMMAAYDPTHLTVLSNVCPTHYNQCCDTIVAESTGGVQPPATAAPTI